MSGPSLLTALRQWWCGLGGHREVSRNGYTEMLPVESLPWGWAVEDGYAWSPRICLHCEYVNREDANRVR